jgi:HSP20 family protein
MFTRFSDLDRTFTVFDELRRRMDRVWDAYEPDVAPAAYDNAFYASTSWPRVDVADAGQSLVFRAEVPGVAEKDFNLTLTADTLTLAGERKATAPEGYTIQRQERPAARFSRSWTLPYKVDAEKTTATLKDGVLTIALAKAAESQPRQIAVRVQS